LRVRFSVEKKPEDLIRAGIEALADNDRALADAGISATYNFASTGNQVMTGALARFPTRVRFKY